MYWVCQRSSSLIESAWGRSVLFCYPFGWQLEWIILSKTIPNFICSPIHLCDITSQNEELADFVISESLVFLLKEIRSLLTKSVMHHWVCAAVRSSVFVFHVLENEEIRHYKMYFRKLVLFIDSHVLYGVWKTLRVLLTHKKHLTLNDKDWHFINFPKFLRTDCKLNYSTSETPDINMKNCN